MNQAIATISFTKGQKVIWIDGQYDFYFINQIWDDCGWICNLINPQGIISGGRVRKDELVEWSEENHLLYR